MCVPSALQQEGEEKIGPALAKIENRPLLGGRDNKNHPIYIATLKLKCRFLGKQSGQPLLD